MTRETLRFKVKRKTEPKPDDALANEVSHDDPKKRFLNGVAIHPSECIRLEAGSAEFTARAIDLISPIGMGQRGLVVASPGCGKTTMLKHICQAVGNAYPEIKLYALLIDERPEEVTDFKRSVPAEVHASSSDDSYDQHARVANDLLNIAIREAGEGHNVMIVIDSLTRLARVHNAKRKSSGRTMSGGLDANAMEIPRKMFGAARNIENGGSLTILATILVDTGSQMDQVIFEEFKGTGNMEIVLSRDVASLRIFPALDIAKSSTRREELLIKASDIGNVRMLRRSLSNLKPEESASKLVDLLQMHPTNADLLKAVQSEQS
ncbi:MAG: transcription termination factor Rho [Reinekea forsetii]|jgi:transcription termination factor Rho|uniref:Transcription termination factor Rho n=1 Tax=Reinekea forsetii TaxID=1336806 RepID=A0A2K8KLB8_9GAMM|nr:MULTISPECIES: transcription termination factor Rho [Reinekea]ATX75710.1 transcription termination factor Rho [Reinekea forsetii]MDB9894166.1 transcription termination factor Rho [Reinekea forsetii]MDO7644182.1 transcription termination factor Rho [Reinekea forsetii]MDO7673457.1 transcription termination factor Rho [Reinekea forsetii]|tara:strand:+ start:105 stop:1067 length:963 start_codon:yes stop_codon:yes gene_type:complete